MTALLERCALHQRPEADIGETFDAITRREFVVGGAAFAALLAACGSDDDAESSRPQTRPFETANGTVEIPVRPERVVALDPYSVNVLLDIDFTPAGVFDNPTVIAPEHEAAYRALEKVGAEVDVNLEAVAALDPDLILTLDFDYLPAIDRLTAIAPAVMFSLEGDWKPLADGFADAVGEASKAAELQQRYDDRTREIRAAHADVLRATHWASAMGRGDELRIDFPDSNGGRALVDAGVRFYAEVADRTGVAEYYSLEQIPLLTDADVIVVEADGTGALTEYTQMLVDHALFRRLPAAQSGRVYPVPYLVPFGYGQVLSLLDGLEAALRDLEGG